MSEKSITTRNYLVLFQWKVWKSLAWTSHCKTIMQVRASNSFSVIKQKGQAAVYIIKSGLALALVLAPVLAVTPLWNVNLPSQCVFSCPQLRCIQTGANWQTLCLLCCQYKHHPSTSTKEIPQISLSMEACLCNLKEIYPPHTLSHFMFEQ